MRIGLLTTLWKREGIENIVLRHYSNLEIPGVELVRLAVGSEGADSLLRAAQNDWHYIAARNRPLSNKHNKGMEWFRDQGVSAVIVIGSDDLMTADTIRYMIDRYRGDADVVVMEDLYYLSSDADRLFYDVRAHPGAGTIYGSKVLDKLNWQLWPADEERRLDGKAMNRVHRIAYGHPVRYVENCRNKGLMLCSLKSDTNMWSISDLRENTGRVTPADIQLFDDAFPGVREELKALNQPTMRETSGG